jgi:hypothetical protein
LTVKSCLEIGRVSSFYGKKIQQIAEFEK